MQTQLSIPTISHGPLKGVTVVDLSRVLAGPYCSLLLVELGARVIKIESPEGDDARSFGPFVGEKSAYFSSYNRGKESIILDLKNDRDQFILHRLLESADVLLENFRPGVMEKLKLDWESIHQKFPRLIYASISGFGQTGPLSQYPAYDMVVQGLSGLMSITGEPNRPPSRVGISIGDLAAGMYAAVAINAALFNRMSSGIGSRIDVAMYDCQVALMDSAVVRYGVTREIPVPLGARHPSISPFEAYATADAPVIIAAGNNRLFSSLVQALGCPQLAGDSRFTTNDLRARHAEELAAELEARLKTKPRSYWLQLFEETAIPCAPINNVADLSVNKQALARNMLIHIQDADCGNLLATGNPMKFSEFPDPINRPGAPKLNEHGQAILAEFGLSGVDSFEPPNL